MKPGINVRFIVALDMTGTAVAVGDEAIVSDPDGNWENDIEDGRLAVELANGHVYYVDLTDVVAA